MKPSTLLLLPLAAAVSAQDPHVKKSESSTSTFVVVTPRDGLYGEIPTLTATATVAKRSDDKSLKVTVPGDLVPRTTDAAEPGGSGSNSNMTATSASSGGDQGTTTLTGTSTADGAGATGSSSSDVPTSGGVLGAGTTSGGFVMVVMGVVGVAFVLFM